jgi:phosphatidylinositol alpha-mannosyltransferase
MRIALVCPYAWDRYGGVQSHVRSLAAALRRHNNHVEVLAPATGIEVADDATIIGRAVPVPFNSSVATVAFGPLAAARIARELETASPDLVHVHEPLIPSLSLLALWEATCPTVGTFHAAMESSFGYWASRPLLADAAERLTVRTAVSEAARRLVARYFPGDYAITPNGVDVARFNDAAPLSFGSGRKVLFLGRIEKRKGLDVLIEAISLMSAPRPRLIVAGTGPEERWCRQLATRLSVDATFVGSLSDDELPGAYRSVDVYCAPGLGRESFGIVLLEAMAAQTPVVCSDIPAFRSVADDAASLVPPDDPNALAEALGRVLSDDDEAKRMSARGLEVAWLFDWDRLAIEVEDVYRTALGER